MIPYGRQFIDNEDIKSVVKVFKIWLSNQGPLTKFENLIQKKTTCKYAVAKIVALQHFIFHV